MGRLNKLSWKNGSKGDSRWFILLLCAFVIAILSASGVIATFSFGNYADFIPTDTIDVYEGRIIFPDILLTTYILEDNTYQCLTDCHAIGTAILYQDGALFDDVIFKNGLPKEASVTLIDGEEYQIDVPDYEDVCVDVPSNLTNETTTRQCTQEQTGSHQETKYRDIPYDGEVLLAGAYKWRIDGKINIGDKIDWVGISNGVELSDWAWWNSTFQYCQNVNVTGNTASISNFPFYVNVTYNAHMNPDFSDIRFVNASCENDGTEMPYEIDYQTASNSAGVWVKTTNLTTGINQYSMYYGNAGASSGENPTSVWADYMGVWHFSEGTGTAVKDSSSKSNNLTCDSSGSWVIKGFGYSRNSTGIGLCNSTSTYALGASARTIIWFEDLNIAGADKFQISLGPGINTGTKQAYRLGGSEAGNTWYYEYIGAGPVWGSYNLGRNMLIASNNGTDDFNYQYNNTYFNSNTASSMTLATATSKLIVGGKDSDQNQKANVNMDDLRLANITFSSAYLNRSWQNNNMSNFVFGAEQAITPQLTAAISYPINYYNTTSTSIGLGCNFTSTNQNISSVKVEVFDSGNNLNYTNTIGSLAQDSYNATWVSSALTDDTYTWNCTGYGSEGYNGSSTTRTFTIDTIAPSVTILAPNSSYIVQNPSENITLNFSATDTHIGSCYYNTTYNATTISLNCSLNSSLLYPSTNPASLTIFVYANDTFGNSNSTNVTITKDATPPIINITYPVGAVYYNSNTTLNYTRSDTNLANCSYSLNGAVNVTIEDCANSTIILTARNNTLIMYANDTFGNTANSSTVYPYYLPQLGLCNSTNNLSFINFTFKNETTNAESVTGAFISDFSYWFDSGTTGSLSFSNSTENPSYAFCINGGDETLYASPTIQYYNSYSPARSYAPGTPLTLTNVTTNKTLYLLPASAGLYVTFQVLTSTASPIFSANVDASRLGVSYGSGLTDGAGTITMFLNPLYSYTICASKTGYSSTCTSITPTQSLYSIILTSVLSSNLTYSSEIEGIYWTKTPPSGVIEAGNTTFTYNVSDTYSHIIGCSFEILNQTKSVLQSNSSTGASNCFVSMIRDVQFGETLYGRYYVDFGNGSIMLEGDGNWYTLYNASAVSPFSLKYILQYMSDQSAWTSGGVQSQDSKIYEFTKFMFLFIILAIVVAFLNLRTNFDMLQPGIFLIGLPFLLWMLSLPAFSGEAGFLYIKDATPFGVFADSIIVALITTLIAIALYLRRQRGLQS